MVILGWCQGPFYYYGWPACVQHYIWDKHGVKDFGCWIEHQKSFCKLSAHEYMELKGIPKGMHARRFYNPDHGDSIVAAEAGWLLKLPASIKHN